MTSEKLLEEQKIFTELCKAKNGVGLFEFSKTRPHWWHRCQRAIIEHCDSDPLNSWLAYYSEKVDYALIVEQIIFFNKKSAERLEEFAEYTQFLECHESDIIFEAAIQAK